jgi:hypothetical protein
MTRRRYAVETRDADGYSVAPATTDTPIMATGPQPATGADLQVLPEGERTKTAIKLYTDSAVLRTVDRDGKFRADEVIVADGQFAGTFKVMAIQGQRAILPHYKAICVEVDES